jgi:hypothetical protein
MSKTIPKGEEPGARVPPKGYEIGGNAVPAHHKSDVLPIATKGEDGPSEFQPPTGQILGDDPPMGDSLQGMTDNVLGSYLKRGDLEAGATGEGGYADLPSNPSVDSLNPSLVDADEPALPAGFCGRANGWER